LAGTALPETITWSYTYTYNADYYIPGFSYASLEIPAIGGLLPLVEGTYTITMVATLNDDGTCDVTNSSSSSGASTSCYKKVSYNAINGSVQVRL